MTSTNPAPNDISPWPYRQLVSAINLSCRPYAISAVALSVRCLQGLKAPSVASHGSIRLHCQRMAVLLGEDVLDKAEPLAEAALLDIAAGLSNGRPRQPHAHSTGALLASLFASWTFVQHKPGSISAHRLTQSVRLHARLALLGLPLVTLQALNNGLS